MNLSKTLAGRTLLAVIFVGLALSQALIFYFIQRGFNLSAGRPDQIEPASPEEQDQTNFGLPARLKIPGINIDATVEFVGLTSQGTMGVPKGPDDVGWYELGPRPGESGSAVMAGHYGTWKNGQGSVFDNLHKLSKGDKLYIEDEKGVTVTFIVRESRSYDPKADAGDVFSSDDEKSHLNLITCEGIWNKTSKSYSERLVVFTDKVDSAGSPQE